MKPSAGELPAARVDAKALAAALDEFRTALGPQWVLAGQAPGLSVYRDDFAPGTHPERAPAAALQPANLKQVMKALDIARRHGIPLWPLSSGRNLGYGGAAPRQAGVVMLDLHRMNRIVEINEKFAYAVVEPGVSHLDLGRELARRESRLVPAPPSAGWGSVIGNLLERGHAYTPQAEQFDNLCGLQVLLGDGTLVDTGFGAFDKSRVVRLSASGHGPQLDGLFAQSNLGIVTRIGLWLRPAPASCRPYRVTLASDDGLHALVETLRPLVQEGMVAPGASIVNLEKDAALLTTRRRYQADEGRLTAATRARLAQDFKLAAWTLYGALYGGSALVANDARELAAALGAVPGARLEFEDEVGDAPAFALRATLARGTADMGAHAALDWVGAGAHLDFDIALAQTGDAARGAVDACRALCDEHGLDYLAELQVGPRDLRHRQSLVFARDNARDRRRARGLYEALLAAAATRGEGVLRTHLDFMDQVAERYAWNDASWLRTCEALKDALDPAGVLAPGKSGLWPGRAGRKRN